jgi:glutaminase
MGPLQERDDPPYVSTGRLPSPEQVRRSVDEAHERYRAVAWGERSRVYPALERVPARLFGICAVGTSGSVDAAGDAGHRFAIMSVAKPFVFALVCQALSTRRSTPRPRPATTATGPSPTCWRTAAASGATRPRRSTATPGRARCG